MRLPLIVTLLLLASLAGAAVTNNNISADKLNSAPSAISVTSTEQTFTFSKTAGTQPRLIMIVADQDIGWSDVTSSYANKVPISSGRSFTFKLNEDSKVYYIQASSTTANVHVYVLDAAP